MPTTCTPAQYTCYRYSMASQRSIGVRSLTESHYAADCSLVESSISDGSWRFGCEIRVVAGRFGGLPSDASRLGRKCKEARFNRHRCHWPLVPRDASVCCIFWLRVEILRQLRCPGPKTTKKKKTPDCPAGAKPEPIPRRTGEPGPDASGSARIARHPPLPIFHDRPRVV